MATGSSAFKVLQCHPCKKACDITSRVLIAGEHTSIEKVAGDLYHGFGVSSSANPLDLAVKVIAKSNTNDLASVSGARRSAQTGDGGENTFSCGASMPSGVTSPPAKLDMRNCKRPLWDDFLADSDDNEKCSGAQSAEAVLPRSSNAQYADCPPERDINICEKKHSRKNKPETNDKLGEFRKKIVIDFGARLRAAVQLVRPPMKQVIRYWSAGGFDLHRAMDVDESTRFYWENFPDGDALSKKTFACCQMRIVSIEEYEASQLLFKKIAHDVNSKSDWSGWSGRALIHGSCRALTHSTVMAVAETDGRFAIKFVYLANQGQNEIMKQLTMDVFGDSGELGASKLGSVHGESVVKKRGNKAFRGTMVMYGFKCQPHNSAYAKANGLCCKSAPCMYNASAPYNAARHVLWKRHMKYLADMERCYLPACSANRMHLADKFDRGKNYRLVDNCGAFAASLSRNFAIAPHDDSGACEAIVFMNQDGPPPIGKEYNWAFAVGGFVLQLPVEKGDTALVFLDGTGVFHGTPPATCEHSNYGSALVSKKATLQMMEKHACGCSL